METIKVLVFAAGPHGTTPLDLARESREIDEEVGRSPSRTAVELSLVPGRRPGDLLRKPNNERHHGIVRVTLAPNRSWLIRRFSPRLCPAPGNPQGDRT